MEKSAKNASADWRLNQRGGFEEGVDVREEGCKAIGFGDDGGDTESRGELFSENIAEHGVDNYRSVGRSRAQEGGSLDAIHMRHGKIEDDEVGAKRGGFVDSFGAVRCFATNLIARMELEENANGVANGDFVLDDEDALGHEQAKHSMTGAAGK